MNLLNRLYSWYGKRAVLITGALIITLAVVGLLLNILLNTTPQESVTNSDYPQVKVGRIDQINSGSTYTITGSVRAVSEARLQAEASGRITSVNADLGDTVRAGFVIATLENSAQRASLLQAEGSYEAALASAASSQSGTQSAETALSSALTSAVTTYRSAFIGADSSVRNTIDDLFTNPTSAVPGFRLDSFGSAVALNQERKELEPVLDDWSAKSTTANIGNIRSYLIEAIADTKRILQYAQTLSSIVTRQNTSTTLTQAQKDALEAEFLSMRSTLNQTLQSLESAQTSIKSSEEALDRAQIAGSSSDVSLADAQIKSALGSLQAARSSYEKTLVRTPISGVVNALYLKEGEYASQGQQAAIIANNNALEITAYVTEMESVQLSIGDTVRINTKAEGTITQIAPAVDPATGKVEIKIESQSETLTNGDTVSIELAHSQAERDADAPIRIPITALKVEVDRIVVFTVSEEGTLVAHQVTEGPLMGDQIIIDSGLTSDMDIVLDARGLNEGDAVEVAS